MRIRSLNRRTIAGAALVAVAVGVALGSAGALRQTVKLTAADAADGDDFGNAVAVEGNTAVVGAYVNDSGKGAVYVFTRTGTAWAPESKLVGSDSADLDHFGSAVAISGDTLVAGALAHDSAKGAAYVFTRSGSAWTEQAKLTADDAAINDVFGVSADVSGDTAIVGAYTKDQFRGAAYVFTRTGTTWTQQAKLTAGADTVINDYFGYSVAIEGDTAVVGAYGRNALQGVAYVFKRTGISWAQEGKLTAADATNTSYLGFSVALAGDTVVVGANGKSALQGAAYVFTRTASVWTQQAKFTAADAANNDEFGRDVAIAGDTVVAGAYGRLTYQGAAYVFTRSGTSWTQERLLTPADAAQDFFGWAVALDGDTAIVGAYAKNESRGAAYVFDLSPGAGPPPGYCLATKAKAKVNATPSKSTLTASGALDTGPGVPDLSGAATFDVGGFHLAVPAFVVKGRARSYTAGGIALKITLAKNGSSHATFSVKATGDLTGKVDLDGPLALRFVNAANDLAGAVKLTSGTLGPRAVTSPTLSVISASATVKGAGKDSLKLTLGFATGGVVPAAAEELTVCFGGTYTSTLAGGWVTKGSTWKRTAKAPGITKASVDYAKGTITLTGSKLDLGAFAPAGNAVVIGVTRGGATRSVVVRMARAGTKLSY